MRVRGKDRLHLGRCRTCLLPGQLTLRHQTPIVLSALLLALHCFDLQLADQGFVTESYVDTSAVHTFS